MKGGVDHWRLSYLRKLIRQALWWPFTIAILLVASALNWRPLGLELPYVLLAFNYLIAGTLNFDFSRRYHKWRQDQAERLKPPVISADTDSPKHNRLWNPWKLPKITKKVAIVMGVAFGAIMWHVVFMPSFIMVRDEELAINRWAYLAGATLIFVVGGFQFGFSIWFFGGRGYREWTDSAGQFSVEAKFVKTIDGIVWLDRSQDGESISIPFSRMSQVDRDLVAAKSKKKRWLFSSFPPPLSDNG